MLTNVQIEGFRKEIQTQQSLIERYQRCAIKIISFYPEVNWPKTPLITILEEATERFINEKSRK